MKNTDEVTSTINPQEESNIINNPESAPTTVNTNPAPTTVNTNPTPTTVAPTTVNTNPAPTTVAPTTVAPTTVNTNPVPTTGTAAQAASTTNLRGTYFPTAPKRTLFKSLYHFATGGFLTGAGTYLLMVGGLALVGATGPVGIVAGALLLTFGGLAFFGGIGEVSKSVSEVYKHYREKKEVNDWIYNRGYTHSEYKEMLNEQHKQASKVNKIERQQEHECNKLSHAIVKDLEKDTDGGKVPFASFLSFKRPAFKKDALTARSCRREIEDILNSFILDLNDVKNRRDDYIHHISNKIKKAHCFNSQGTFSPTQRAELKAAISSAFIQTDSDVPPAKDATPPSGTNVPGVGTQKLAQEFTPTTSRKDTSSSIIKATGTGKMVDLVRNQGVQVSPSTGRNQ